MVSKWSTLKEIQKNTSDWKVVKLNSFSTKAKNSFVNGPFGSDLLSSELTNEGRPVVYIRDIQNGSYKNKSNICITEEKFESLPSCQVVFGDVIISKVGAPPCEAAIYDSQISGIVTQDVIRIRCEELPQSIFLKYLLNSDIGKRQVQQIKISGTRERVSLTDFKKIRLPQPTINEQQKIANILSTWDNAISTTECLIDNSTQQKKALMQQLLTGKKRLLDESGKRFEGEWGDVKLSAIVKVTGGNAFKSTDFKDSGIPLIKISNIKPDYSVSIKSSVFIALDQKYDKFQIKNGDVLIAMSGATTGKIGKYTFDEIAYLNQRVGRFDVRKGLTTKSYIFQLLKLPKIQHEILIDAVGGAQPNISNKDIERIKILIPPIKEQQKIATVLTSADKEIDLLKQQLVDLQQEKKALMQVLLTGKVRVVVERES
ncbi:restriction endonuclease subunit S [Psychrobacter vallis]|uniref:restriction endonuclease subunit S n=1 Tax=Psychrobacter vallis TaxID=248451 RepID=UPI001918744C|nr:restriction endonuclease subunit S [Psychrobacter vallis]